MYARLSVSQFFRLSTAVIECHRDSIHVLITFAFWFNCISWSFLWLYMGGCWYNEWAPISFIVYTAYTQYMHMYDFFVINFISICGPTLVSVEVCKYAMLQLAWLVSWSILTTSSGWRYTEPLVTVYCQYTHMPPQTEENLDSDNQNASSYHCA